MLIGLIAPAKPIQVEVFPGRGRAWGNATASIVHLVAQGTKLDDRPGLEVAVDFPSQRPVAPGVILCLPAANGARSPGRARAPPAARCGGSGNPAPPRAEITT